MHQSLLSYQEYSVASLRMLHPNLYPSELMVAAHDKFLGYGTQKGGLPTKVMKGVDDKSKKFPWHSTVHTMRGLVFEGQNMLEEALSEYHLATYLAKDDDWQPRWRLGLLQQRLGDYNEGNRTMTHLMNEFEGIGDLYRNLPWLSDQKMFRGPVYLNSLG